jgi:cyclase
MKRHVVLGAVLMVGSLAAVVGTAQRQTQPAAAQIPQPTDPPSAAALVVDKLKDNLYVIRGANAGGNTAVFLTSEGVTLVDTKIPGWGRPLIEKVKTITTKPIVRVINTHAHFDHVSGNVDFPATIDIVTHENTRKYMDESNPVSGVQTGQQPNLFKQNGGRGMPKRTFKTDLTIGSGAERIDLRYFGCAHTGGDAFVVFPALRTMHVGDVFPNKGLPIMDRNNGGCGGGYAETIAKAAVATANSIDTIITGHTDATATMADFREYGDFVRGFVSDVRAAKKAGKTVDEVEKTWKPSGRFASYGTGFAGMLRADIETVYNEK